MQKDIRNCAEIIFNESMERKQHDNGICIWVRIMRKIHWVMLVALLLFPVAAFWFYPQMPDSMATHWGFNGEPNGYMSKFAGTFVIPLILMIPLTVLWIVSVAMSKSPKTDQIKGRKPILIFDSFLAIMTIFFLAVYTSTLIWNAGYHFSMNLFVGIAIAALFISINGSVIFILLKKDGSSNEVCGIAGGQIATDGYKDSLIEITNDRIIFNDYYFPMGNKTVKLSEVDYVDEKPLTSRNGKWRFHGSNDFKTWLPADYSRYKRDKVFIVKIKGKWMQIGFTVENSQAVSEILKNRNLIKS